MGMVTDEISNMKIHVFSIRNQQSDLCSYPQQLTYT